MTDFGKVGRNNRKRGNAINAEACKRLHIRNVGPLGGPDDGGDKADWLVEQCKSGGYFPKRIDSWLRALPAAPGQLRAVVTADTPGAGHCRRWLITFDMAELLAWLEERGAPWLRNS